MTASPQLAVTCRALDTALHQRGTAIRQLADTIATRTPRHPGAAVTTPADGPRTTTTLPITWIIEHGYCGRWHASSSFDTKAEADDSLIRRHASLGPGQELRLVRVETTVVRTIEGSVARALDGGRP